MPETMKNAEKTIDELKFWNAFRLADEPKRNAFLLEMVWDFMKVADSEDIVDLAQYLIYRASDIRDEEEVRDGKQHTR